MLHVCKPTNFSFAPLREFHTALLQYNFYSISSFALYTSLIYLIIRPPPLSVLPTSLLIISANLIEDLPVLLEINYANWFIADVNIPFLLDMETNRLSIS